MAGITVYLFPIGEAEPAGFTRSDASGAYRIEIENNPPERMLLIFNSNRHDHHDGRFLPHQDRVGVPEEGNTLRRLYYLSPVEEAPPSKGNVYVIKDLCNVRAAPNTEAPVVAQVKNAGLAASSERTSPHSSGVASPEVGPEASLGLHLTVDEAVQAARTAFQRLNLLPLARRDEIIRHMRQASPVLPLREENRSCSMERYLPVLEWHTSLACALVWSATPTGLLPRKTRESGSVRYKAL